MRRFRSWKFLALAALSIAAFLGGCTWQQYVSAAVTTVLAIGFVNAFRSCGQAANCFRLLLPMFALYLMVMFLWPALNITVSLYGGMLMEPDMVNLLTNVFGLCAIIMVMLYAAYGHLVSAIRQDLSTN